MKKHKCYTIYSLTPTPKKKDLYRLVEVFDTMEDAEFVLAALEKVNVSFHCYKIIEESYEDVELEKEISRNEHEKYKE